jgi:hypothetical protein
MEMERFVVRPDGVGVALGGGPFTANGEGRP